MKSFVISLIALAALAAGCSRAGPGLKGNGVIVRDPRTIPSFSKIHADGGYVIDWVDRGSSPPGVTADQNLLPHIKTVVTGDTLKIESDVRLDPTTKIIIRIYSPTLEEIQLSGDIHFSAVDINGKDLRIQASGAADIQLFGTVTNLTANLVGDGSLKADRLQTQNTNLSIVGSYVADVTATASLKVSVIGDGTCTYGGSPPIVEKTGIGSVNVRPRP